MSYQGIMKFKLIRKIVNHVDWWLANKGYYDNWADKKFLEYKFKRRIGRKLDLENPKAFNDKMQWLKLYDRNPKYTMMVDKYLVKDYVSHLIGNEYVIPTLGAWDYVEDIDFESLPDQFVLKCNHNSGGLVICKNKTTLDIEKAKYTLQKSFNEDFYLRGREYPYKNIHRKIIAEEYVSDGFSDSLTDYKLMCFNGKVKCAFVCSNRTSKSGLNVNFYDREWNPMCFERHYPRNPHEIDKPISYEKMVQMAEILSADLPFVRVDFYQINGKPMFGELTFYPGSGFEEFTQEEWDYTLGSWIELTNVKME